MKKFYIFLLVSLLFPVFVLADTYSADLEDSSDEYFNITDANQTGLDDLNDFTWEAWVYLESANGELIRKGSYGASLTYWLQIYANDLFFYDNENLGGLRFDWNNTTGTWYHLAFVRDYTAGKARFYVNGSLTGGELSLSGSSSADNALDFTMGYVSGEPGFDGLIDEVRFWSDVRTAEEISENYDCELVGNESGLVSYWKFENDATDSSGSNDLTENNTPTYVETVPTLTGTCGATPTPTPQTYSNSTSTELFALSLIGIFVIIAVIIGFCVIVFIYAMV